MSVRKRKLKSGKVVYDAVLEYGYDHDGKRIRETKTFDSKSDAEQADRIAHETSNALKSKSGRLTFSQYVERCYWPIASRRLEATTLDTYERVLRLHIMPTLGKIRLDKIDRYSVQTALDRCKTESVSKNTLAVIKSVLSEAQSDGYISTNPAMLKYAHPPKGKNRDNGLILSDFEQIAQFIDVVGNDAPEAITRLVMTGLLLGLRPEERYALDFEDIDFQNRLVRVNKAYVTVSGKRGGHVTKIPKTEYSNRNVPMPQMFVDHVYWEPNGTGAYITNKKGGRLSPSTAQKMWTRYLDAHPELPRITLENMRHSYATSCIHAGMVVADLSRILGHSNINTTYQRYVRPQWEDMQKSMKSIDAIVR